MTPFEFTSMSKKLTYILGGSVAVLIILVIVLALGKSKQGVSNLPTASNKQTEEEKVIVLDAFLEIG